MKTNLDSLFASDENLEKDGIWFEITDKTAFLIRRMGGQNEKFAKLYASMTKPYARRMQNGTMDPKIEERIYMDCFVDACLVDWRGMVIDGEEATFSKDLAKKVLSQPKLKDLLATLLDYASNAKFYKEVLSDEELKDLGNS